MNKARKYHRMTRINDVRYAASPMPLMVRMYPIHNGKKEYSDIIPALDHAKTHDIAVSVVPRIRSIRNMNYKSNTECWYIDDMFRSDRTALTFECAQDCQR